jgi:hypothetical protein
MKFEIMATQKMRYALFPERSSSFETCPDLYSDDAILLIDRERTNTGGVIDFHQLHLTVFP